MIGVPPNFFKIIVFPADAYAFLCIDCPRIRALALAKEDVLELVHTRVRKQE